MLTDIKKAAASGILISIGGCVLLASTKSGMMWAGAVLFSLGLFAICEYGFNLYTGKVGYIAEHFKDFKYIRLVLLILVVNLLTTFIMGILVSFCLPEIAESARASYESKLAADPKKWVRSADVPRGRPVEARSEDRRFSVRPRVHFQRVRPLYCEFFL